MLFQDFDPCYTKQASNFMEISFQVRYDSFTNKTDQDFDFLVFVTLNQATCTLPADLFGKMAPGEVGV